MASKSYTPAKTSLSRVFLIEGRARADHAPSYESCMRMTGLSQGLGDIDKIECPDPENYGKFIETGQIRGAKERVTFSLEGRYALELKSTMMRLARKGCSIDIQLHLGDCTDPREFSTFKKAVILENASITNYSTGDMGALGSGDDASVEETVDISAEDMYEVLPVTFAERAKTVVTNELLKVILCDTLSCGECGEESDGCTKYYAISKAAGGSPSTPPDIVYSLDGGVNWIAHDIDTLSAAEDPSDIACVGAYVVVVSNTANSLTYVAKTELATSGDPTWTEVTTGFVAGGEPNAIKSIGNSAFIVGDAGYIYYTDDATAGVEVLDAGVATASTLLDVDALSDSFAVAVGQNGVVVYTDNGTTWAALATPPVGVGISLNCVALKSEKEWLVGTSTGVLYITYDAGATWTAVAFPGSGSGVVRDIQIATDSIYYLAHSTTAPRGRILRSFSAGNEWVVMPENSGTLPLNDRINSIATCSFDPDKVVAVGLADNGTDGIIVAGESS